MMTLREEFEQVMGHSKKRLERFSWENRENYASWLAQTYFFVRNSTRLLAQAAGHCSLRDDILHKRFLSHLREESGHEAIALRDLKAMGYEISDFEELPATRDFYMRQFYTIQNESPIAFMGWILFLEGIAAKFGAIAKERTQHYGKEGTRFLHLHADEDIGHLESAFQAIQIIPQQDLFQLTLNMKDSCQRYISILDGIQHGYMSPDLTAC